MEVVFNPVANLLVSLRSGRFRCPGFWRVGSFCRLYIRVQTSSLLDQDDYAEESNCHRKKYRRHKILSVRFANRAIPGVPLRTLVLILGVPQNDLIRSQNLNLLFRC